MAEDKGVVSIQWKDESLTILDQTRLPNHLIMEKQSTVEQVWESIKSLKVRGAPAIGVAGAYGLLIGLREYKNLGRDDFLDVMKKTADYLDTARPTAVNLNWALRRMLVKAQRSSAENGKQLYEVARAEAEAIHREDIQLCKAIGEHGLFLIKEGSGILTHCNAGRLATSEYGTATSPMYLAHERGISFRVYSDESRPLLQGARLTAWELMQAGIDVTTITDNMAAFVMSQGLVDLVIVGTDRVAANGDAANKIGTLGVAILADYYHIPFYVACPSSTVDLSTPDGDGIIIEERADTEVTCIGTHRIAPEGIKVMNPAFDVTPHTLVAGIITDRGMIYPPYDKALRERFGDAESFSHDNKKNK